MQTHALISFSLLVALAGTGCQSQFGASANGSSSQSSTEMSRARAAQVCLVTAQNLDRNGYDKEAVGEYERSRELDPTLKGIARRLAVLYDRRGNDARAMEEYKTALRENPFDADVLNDLGYFYIVRNNGPEAEPWLRLAVTKDPKSERAWVNLATALAEQRKYSEAYGAFTRVLSVAQSWSNLGMIQSQQGDYKLSVQSLSKAIAADPNMLQAQAALQWAKKKSVSPIAAP